MRNGCITEKIFNIKCKVKLTFAVRGGNIYFAFALHSKTKYWIMLSASDHILLHYFHLVFLQIKNDGKSALIIFTIQLK
jgi:hypothetical protein